MRLAARFGWLLRQAALSLRAMFTVRRGGVLVLTHEPDIDRDGTDVQMGAVVDELERRGAAYFELVLLRLNGSAWTRRRALRSTPFFGWAVLEALARLLALGRAAALERARVRVAGWLLAITRPRAVLLIDEAGSGRALVAAARRRGIPSLGVQHGDFLVGSQQYSRETRAEPVDRLCVWSEWFAARLLAISGTYTESSLCVTGRARPSLSRATPVAGRVLVLSRPGLREEAAKLLGELAREPGLDLRVRPHPGEEAWTDAGLQPAGGSLAEELASASLVLGSATSALFEALFLRRPILELGGSSVSAVRGALDAGWTEADEELRARAWGDAPEEASAAIVDALEELLTA